MIVFIKYININVLTLISTMDDDLQKLVGNRLRQLVNFTGLSQRDFAKKYGFKYSTLNAWLVGRLSLYLLTAKKLIDAFNQEGVVCSIDWLFDENSPVLQSKDKIIPVSASDHLLPFYEDEFLLQEMTFLKKLNPNFTMLRVNDAAMKPIYNPGDYVGGAAVYGTGIQKLTGHVCIIETLDGQKSLRALHYIPEKKSYEGKSLTNKAFPPVLIPESQLFFAARVFWHIHMR